MGYFIMFVYDAKLRKNNNIKCRTTTIYIHNYNIITSFTYKQSSFLEIILYFCNFNNCNSIKSSYIP